MKKLSKEQVARRNALAVDLQYKIDAVGEAVSELNAMIVQINTFAEEVRQEQSDYFDERSEKWQEGDGGTEYCAWMTEWEFALDELSDPTDDVDLDGFESLPEEPA